MARRVQQSIAEAIRQGCVVMTHKTKARSLGGRQLVSIGPYRTAVSKGKRYAVITKNDQAEFLTAQTAAQHFVEFVGRDRAWDALQRKCNKDTKCCPRGVRTAMKRRR